MIVYSVSSSLSNLETTNNKGNSKHLQAQNTLTHSHTLRVAVKNKQNKQENSQMNEIQTKVVVGKQAAYLLSTYFKTYYQPVVWRSV